jgi:hypothetical protein
VWQLNGCEIFERNEEIAGGRDSPVPSLRGNAAAAVRLVAARPFTDVPPEQPTHEAEGVMGRNGRYRRRRPKTGPSTLSSTSILRFSPSVRPSIVAVSPICHSRGRAVCAWSMAKLGRPPRLPHWCIAYGYGTGKGVRAFSHQEGGRHRES